MTCTSRGFCRTSGSFSKQPGSSHLQRVPMEKTTHRVGEIPGVCLCIRSGVGFREVSQRKLHLCKGTAAWTSPKEPPQRAHNAPGKHWASATKRADSQTGGGGRGRERGFAPFTLMPQRAEPCLGPALERRGTFELSASLIYFFYSWKKKN